MSFGVLACTLLSPSSHSITACACVFLCVRVCYQRMFINVCVSLLVCAAVTVCAHTPVLCAQCEWVPRIASSIRELKLKGMCGNECRGAFMSRPIVQSHTPLSAPPPPPLSVSLFFLSFFLSLSHTHTFNCSLLITLSYSIQKMPLHSVQSVSLLSASLFCLSEEKQG